MQKKSLRTASFPRTLRLRKTKEFQLVQNRGKRLHTKHFTLIANLTNRSSRLGITVSKKVDKRAVIRNKIKRRVREAMRLCLAELNRKVDLVIIAKSGAGELNSEEIRSQLYGSLQKTGLLNK